jgi:hypothetical protein
MSPTQPRLRLKDKRRRLAWVKVAVGSAVVALTLVLALYALNRPEANIHDISITGAKLSNVDLMREVAESILDGSYFAIIPRTNVLLLPYQKLEENIQSAFPQVASVVASQTALGTLEIAITERVPVALWCADSGDCYLMDGSGYVFDSADSHDGLIRYSGRIKGMPVGSVYLDGTFRVFSKAISSLEEATKQKVTDVYVDEYGDAYATLLEGGDIIFALSPEYSELVDNAASVFQTERFTSTRTLDYADFRYGNKVYVRFMGE